MDTNTITFQIIVTLITIILGGTIGFFSAMFLERRKNSLQWNIKIFELYNEIIKEVIHSCKQMASLNLTPNGFKKEDLINWKIEISELYFTYYNLLPQEVLSEMNCLHSCLSCGGKYAYYIDEQKRLQKIQNKNEIDNFINDSSLVSNNERLTKIVNLYGIDAIPNYIKINFQSRRVIKMIDKYFRQDNIHDWAGNLKKSTIHELHLTKKK